MSETVVETPVSPAAQVFAILRLAPAIEMTDDQFFALCQQNRDLRLERTAQGDIIVMPPPGFETGNQEYIENGARLGWLIDPEARRVHVYRPGVANVCVMTNRNLNHPFENRRPRHLNLFTPHLRISPAERSRLGHSRSP